MNMARLISRAISISFCRRSRESWARYSKLFSSWHSRRGCRINRSAENLALRQQLLVLKRGQKRPPIKNWVRMFWIGLSRIWSGWRDALLIVKPDTVVRWHRQEFKAYWRRKTRSGKRCRPTTDPAVKAIVIEMANANPTWGGPKIYGELLKLGIEISARTVSGLVRKHRRKPPSLTWRTSIKNHMQEMIAVSFL